MKKISTAIVFFAIAVTAISFTAAQEWFVRETSNYTIQFPAAPEDSHEICTF